MSGPAEKDRFKKLMFEDGNRVRFERAIDDDARNWWIERFYDPFGLTPEGMGDLLTKSVSNEKSITYRYIDGGGQAFAVRIQGRFQESGDIWFAERSLELEGGFFNADEMFIPIGDAKQGRGRLLMKDLIEAARSINVERIKIQAQKIGRYAWLRIGFVPDGGSWRGIQAEAARLIQAHAGRLGAARASDLIARVLSGKPATAIFLAGLNDPVSSRQLFDRQGMPVLVPLGKALFLEGGTDWTGELNLNDPGAMEIANDYIRSIGGDDG